MIVSEPFATFDKQSDSGLHSVRFPDQQDSISPSYLIGEGIFYHANRIPDAIFLRLPTLTADLEFVDITFSRAATLVEYLIEKIPRDMEANGIRLHAGTVISLLTLPYVHSIFYWLALIRLGCTIQWFNHELGREAMETLLGHSNSGAHSDALIHCGLNESEKKILGIDTLYSRIGVNAIEFDSEMFSVNLAKSLPKKQPRLPVSEARLWQEIDEEQPCVVIHTSGSTSLPKLVKMSAWAIGKMVGPAWASGARRGEIVPPCLNISRSYWSTGMLLNFSAIVAGLSIAFCNPEDRLYPTINQVLDNVEATGSRTTLLYPGQISDLAILIKKSEKYRNILSAMKLILLCGAGIDQSTNDLITSLNVSTTFANVHGWSEIGGSTGLMTLSAPYNRLKSTEKYALFERVKEDYEGHLYRDNKHNNKIVRLWISFDIHPIAWHMFKYNHSPIKPRLYPGPGPFHDRPAINTGDLFEEVKSDDGQIHYIYLSRDDDLIRLTNLYRPNVMELESILRQKLTTLPGGIPSSAIDTLQIFGNMKPKLSLIIQLFYIQVQSLHVEKVILDAVRDLDTKLPESVQFRNLDRVKIIMIDREDIENTSSMILRKTHKDTPKRASNLITFSTWIDNLNYS